MTDRLGPYELNTIVTGGCAELMAKLPDGCIDLTVTSPPYDNLRDYNGYDFGFEAIAAQLWRVTKPGGVVVWVVADSVENGSETLNSMRQALHFVDDLGFLMHDTMIYGKDGLPFPDTSRYYQTAEYMFVLSRGRPETINLLRTKTTHRRDTFSTQRQKNGQTVKMQYEMGKQTRVLTNIWRLGTGYNKTTGDRFAYDHPAMFPEELARRHILSWSNPGDVVLDPMCGAGTTCKTAHETGRRFLGFDISEEYCEIAWRRVRHAKTPLPLELL